MENCILRWYDQTVVVRFAYGDFANTELRRACPGVRYDVDAGGWVVPVWVGRSAGPLLDYAARYRLIVSPQAREMLEHAARLERERAARLAAYEAEQAAWNARPARTLDEVRRAVGPILWRPRFSCYGCDGKAWGWMVEEQAGSGRGWELRHLVTQPGPRRITATELAMLTDWIDAWSAEHAQAPVAVVAGGSEPARRRGLSWRGRAREGV